MDLYLQFGHNMQKLCCELIAEWGGGTVILSPRDCDPPDEEKSKPGKLEVYAQAIKKAGGRVLVDPQFYLPDANHAGLTEHGYWPKEYDSAEFWKGSDGSLSGLVRDVGLLNAQVEADAVILPGTLADKITSDWLDRQHHLVVESVKQYGGARPLYATVALSPDALKETAEVHELLSNAGKWNVAGIYLVCEHPEGQYLVDQFLWIKNLLDLTAGLRLRGFEVVIGYSNQQTLFAGCAHASAIASGTHRMKRRFSRHDLMEKEDDGGRQATFYYCPHAFSDFKIPILDLAHAQGILPLMRHSASLGVNYADDLFSGVAPTTVATFKYTLSFKHYLGCLRAQARSLVRPTFEATIQSCKDSIDGSRVLLETLGAKRVRAEERSFFPVADPTYVALTEFEKERGAVLRRKWSKM